MRLLRACVAIVCGFGISAAANAQTINYFGASGALSGNTWSTNIAGPYNSAFNTTGGGIATFNNTASFTGGSITVAAINVSANITQTAGSGTISTLSNGVIPVTVDANFTADFNANQSWSSSITAGYIKNGDGVLALSGNTFGGGFTLNAGTVIARGINAMGGNTTTPGPLNLNGGIVAANATRDFSGKYSAINVGGNVQFGDSTGLASATANMTFSNSVLLGSSNRTLTIGNNGTVIFSGVVASTGSTGITFSGTAGSTGNISFTNTANTYAGTTTILGGEARFSADGSLGLVPGSVTADSIVLDGGRLGTPVTGTVTINSNRGIQVSGAAGTAITPNGSSVLAYDGIIADKPSTTGNFNKQGSGTLILGGVSTYSGDSAIRQGIVQLTTGNDRLPTGTAISFGQAASSNVGRLDLNGFNQTLAGLNSITGTNVSANRNTVTSSTAATLTLAGSGDYSYSDDTPSNSGLITGAISVVKNGSGRQALGGSNTYTGTTTINNGILAVNGAHTGGGAYTVNSGGTLAGSGNITATINISGGILSPGISSGIGGVLTQNGNVTFSATSTYEVNLTGPNPGGNGYDQINILGTNRILTLNNAILNVSLGFTPNPTDKFFIINNDDPSSSLIGTFAGLTTNGATINIGSYTGNITYVGDFLGGGLLTGGNDIVIYNLTLAAVPEPGTIALMGLVGFGALQWYLRRKSNDSSKIADGATAEDDKPTAPNQQVA